MGMEFKAVTKQSSPQEKMRWSLRCPTTRRCVPFVRTEAGSSQYSCGEIQARGATSTLPHEAER